MLRCKLNIGTRYNKICSTTTKPKLHNHTSGDEAVELYLYTSVNEKKLRLLGNTC